MPKRENAIDLVVYRVLLAHPRPWYERDGQVLDGIGLVVPPELAERAAIARMNELESRDRMIYDLEPDRCFWILALLNALIEDGPGGLQAIGHSDRVFWLWWNPYQIAISESFRLFRVSIDQEGYRSYNLITTDTIPQIVSAIRDWANRVGGGTYGSAR